MIHPSAGMYSCEATTTSFRSMVASGEMRVIGGLRVALKNIARGTTDPEIDFVTWTEFGNNTAPLALVANLATR